MLVGNAERAARWGAGVPSPRRRRGGCGVLAFFLAFTAASKRTSRPGVQWHPIRALVHRQRSDTPFYAVSEAPDSRLPTRTRIYHSYALGRKLESALKKEQENFPLLPWGHQKARTPRARPTAIMHL